MRALITTVPFAARDRTPLELLESAGIDYLINPLGRKLSEDELAGLIGEFDLLIAGTEPITARVLDQARRLKLISRVGIGLDSVDLLAARAQDIAVCYTPDAPAPAVAELTVGLMVDLLRSTHLANLEMHRGRWQRHFGRRLADVTIGVIGVGRIGTRVLNLLAPFAPGRVLVNDLDADRELPVDLGVEWVDKTTLYRQADLITLHLPLTDQTRNLIGSDQLDLMKTDALIVNTARGGIINEDALAEALRARSIGGAAVDVFVDEPYQGPLAEIDGCLLTCHMGSMSLDCRARMESEAAEEVVRFVRGRALANPVPAFEYQTQQIGR